MFYVNSGNGSQVEKPVKLTERQKRFADEYLIDLNATASYKRAGYAGSGNTAEVNAHKILRNAKVATFIATRQRELQEKTGITQERVLAEFAKIGFLDARKFFDERGQLRALHELDDDTAAALAGMDIAVERSGTDADGAPTFADVKKIKIIDKLGALNSLARHLGMFNDKQQITGKDGGPIEIIANGGGVSGLLALARGQS